MGGVVLHLQFQHIALIVESAAQLIQIDPDDGDCGHHQDGHCAQRPRRDATAATPLLLGRLPLRERGGAVRRVRLGTGPRAAGPVRWPGRMLVMHPFMLAEES
ncbi:hypothetical protein GCM10009618_17090 [Nesterenkonia lacusekhoensis]